MRHSPGPRLIWAMMTSLAILPGLTGTALAASEHGPTASVKNALSELIRILDNQDLNHPGRVEERRLQIERMLRSHVSYEEMARRSLGRPWANLNEAEQREFADLFVRFLANSVSGWKMERERSPQDPNEAHDELVTYLSERYLGGHSEVRTRLRSLKVDTSVDFRLVNQAGTWRVYDVVVDHVSIAGNYRSQFSSILRLFSLAELESKIMTIVPILKLFEKTAAR
jgi:phospholipid transport system substrate-binding protein